MTRREFLQTAFLGAATLSFWPWEIGCQVAEAAWNTKGGEGIPIKENYFRFGDITLRPKTDAIVIHHMGTRDADVSASIVHQWHHANGWLGIGYHYLIRRDGTIERGRPRNTTGAHCYGENEHTIGIGLTGNFDYLTPNDEQLNSLVKLVSVVGRMYNMPLNNKTVLGHRDFCSTRCPGTNLYTTLPQVIKAAARMKA